MIVHYDFSTRKWMHESGVKENISLGSGKWLTSLADSPPSTENRLQFDLNLKAGKAGPLIGILTAMNQKMALSGSGPLFHLLHQEVRKRKGLLIIFPPEKLLKDSITGVLFSPEQKKWIQVTTPLPDIVYNRVPFRKSEKLPAFLDAVKFFSAMGIPFFNPSFINKDELYTLFRENNQLRTLMPETIPIHSFEALASFFEKHPGIYMKKVSASRGAGIFRLRKTDGKIEMASHSEKKIYVSLDDLWKDIGDHLLKANYIAQREISPSQFGDKRFDFRIHAIDGPRGYEVTGIGIRQASAQDLTTHLPNGGKILPYELLRNERHDSFFSDIVKTIGLLLSEKLGYFGEFSIDAALDEKGDYVIYEVNSKPMSFDEMEIEKKRISALANLLFRKSGF